MKYSVSAEIDPCRNRPNDLFISGKNIRAGQPSPTDHHGLSGEPIPPKRFSAISRAKGVLNEAISRFGKTERRSDRLGDAHRVPLHPHHGAVVQGDAGDAQERDSQLDGAPKKLR